MPKQNAADAAYDYIWGEQKAPTEGGGGVNPVSVDALWRKRVNDELSSAKQWPDNFNYLLTKGRPSEKQIAEAPKSWERSEKSKRRQARDFQKQLQEEYIRSKQRDMQEAMKTEEELEDEAMHKFMNNFARKNKIERSEPSPGRGGKQYLTSQDYGMRGDAGAGNLERFGRLILNMR